MVTGSGTCVAPKGGVAGHDWPAEGRTVALPAVPFISLLRLLLSSVAVAAAVAARNEGATAESDTADEGSITSRSCSYGAAGTAIELLEATLGEVAVLRVPAASTVVRVAASPGVARTSSEGVGCRRLSSPGGRRADPAAERASTSLGNSCDWKAGARFAKRNDDALRDSEIGTDAPACCVTPAAAGSPVPASALLGASMSVGRRGGACPAVGAATGVSDAGDDGATGGRREVPNAGTAMESLLAGVTRSTPEGALTGAGVAAGGSTAPPMKRTTSGEGAESWEPSSNGAAPTRATGGMLAGEGEEGAVKPEVGPSRSGA